MSNWGLATQVLSSSSFPKRGCSPKIVNPKDSPGPDPDHDPFLTSNNRVLTPATIWVTLFFAAPFSPMGLLNRRTTHYRSFSQSVINAKYDAGIAISCTRYTTPVSYINRLCTTPRDVRGIRRGWARDCPSALASSRATIEAMVKPERTRSRGDMWLSRSLQGNSRRV